MVFLLVICSLIFLNDFSLELSINLGNDKGQRNSKTASDDYESTQEMKNSLKVTTAYPDTYSSVAVLDEEMCLKIRHQQLKSYIDEVEKHYAIMFDPYSSDDESNSSSLPDTEIRRLKWDYILDKAKGSIFVHRLVLELEKVNVSEAKFCENIAEIYSLLNNESLVVVGKVDSGCDPLQNNSIVAFLNAISVLKLDENCNEENVRIPKSLFQEFVRKDAEAVHELEQNNKYWQSRIYGLKRIYRDTIRFARGEAPYSLPYLNSEISSNEY